jgi:hypothetical protein
LRRRGRTQPAAKGGKETHRAPPGAGAARRRWAWSGGQRPRPERPAPQRRKPPCCRPGRPRPPRAEGATALVAVHSVPFLTPAEAGNLAPHAAGRGADQPFSARPLWRQLRARCGRRDRPPVTPAARRRG